MKNWCRTLGTWDSVGVKSQLCCLFWFLKKNLPLSSDIHKYPLQEKIRTANIKTSFLLTCSPNLGDFPLTGTMLPALYISWNRCCTCHQILAEKSAPCGLFKDHPNHLFLWVLIWNQPGPSETCAFGQYCLSYVKLSHWVSCWQLCLGNC